MPSWATTYNSNIRERLSQAARLPRLENEPCHPAKDPTAHMKLVCQGQEGPKVVRMGNIGKGEDRENSEDA